MSRSESADWNSSGLQKMRTAAFMFYTLQCRQERKHPRTNLRHFAVTLWGGHQIELRKALAWLKGSLHCCCRAAPDRVQCWAFQFYPVAELAVWYSGYKPDLFNQRQEVYPKIHILRNSGCFHRLLSLLLFHCLSRFWMKPLSTCRT